MEDLWCFNDETLARTIAASRIPVISAVGHEIDFTICDFAADLRVPTPSAAAELVIGRRDEFIAKLERSEKDLNAAVRLRISNLRSILERLAGSPVFHEPRRALDLKRQYLDELDLRLTQALKNFHAAYTNRLDRALTALNTLNPRSQLERGYVMAFDPGSGNVVTSAKIAPGRELELHFADGKLKVETK